MKHNLMASLARARPLVVAGLLFVGACACAGSQDPSGLETNPMLHAVGSRLLDAEGNPVLLRGVNLGGWLDWEGWMFSEGFISETEILTRLEMLVGSDAAQAFRRGIYSNFIAAGDLRKIAALGFNSVRVPVNYRLLDSQAHKAVYEEAGWQLLDRLLDWCDQYHLYAVLDLHAAPGGQSGLFMADPGDAKLSLWASTEHQHQTVALWHALAGRYKTRRCVAGYDLINEPGPSKGGQWADLTRQLVETIRAEDRQHLLFIEGGSLATDFSMFGKPLDANMAYSFHIYTWFGDNRSQRLTDYQILAGQQNVPLWVGEFGENNYKMIGTTVNMFDEHPEICGWAFWSWKRAPSSHPGLVTVKVPAGWQKVMAWINHPILRQKPTTAEARQAIKEFLEAVKLENGQLDQQMLQELLPH